MEQQERKVKDMTLNAKMQLNSLNQREFLIRQKEKELRKQRNKNKEYLHSLKTKEKDLNSLVNDKAKEIYQKEEKLLKTQIRTPLGIFILYSVIITLTKILDNNILLEDIKKFFIWIKDYILNFPSTIKSIWNYSIYKEGGFTNYLELSFSFIDWIILILRLGLMFILVILIIVTTELIKKYYKEELSVYIFMVNLAIIVFLGDRIKELVDVNLVSIFLIVYSVSVWVIGLKLSNKT